MKLIFSAVIFLLFTCNPFVMHSQTIDDFSQVSFEVVIEERNILKLIVVNNGEEIAQIPHYPSSLNYISVINPLGHRYALNPTYCTTGEKPVTKLLRALETDITIYDVSKRIFDTPYRGLSVFSSYAGEYKFIWVINNVNVAEVTIDRK